MTGPAIVMMVLFLLVIWGGLVLSVYNFWTHPDEVETERPGERHGTPTSASGAPGETRTPTSSDTGT